MDARNSTLVRFTPSSRNEIRGISSHRITSHLRRCRLHYPAPPRHEHLLSAGLQQRHRCRIVRLDVEVRRPQRAPLATPLDPVAVIKRFVARVLESPAAPPTTRTPPPASSAPVTATTVPAVAPTAVAPTAPASSVAAATASGRAAATTPAPIVQEEGGGRANATQTEHHRQIMLVV